MELSEIEMWLTTSIFGIIILGAFGSIIAVLILKLLSGMFRKLDHIIRGIHKKIFYKQAYFLGYIASAIHHDKSNRAIIALMVYRSMRMILSSLFVAINILAILIIVTSVEYFVLSFWTYLPILFGFLSIYWCYYEYEFVYRMYLTYWKIEYENAEEKYKEQSEVLFKKISEE